MCSLYVKQSDTKHVVLKPISTVKSDLFIPFAPEALNISRGVISRFEWFREKHYIYIFFSMGTNAHRRVVDSPPLKPPRTSLKLCGPRVQATSAREPIWRRSWYSGMTCGTTYRNINTMFRDQLYIFWRTGGKNACKVLDNRLGNHHEGSTTICRRAETRTGV